jgi:choline-sulfatase
MIIQHLRVAVALLAVALCAGCGGGGGKTDSAPASKPSILLITLDTTRADAIGPEASEVDTPAFNAVAARGRRFRQAYATVPETLPSHISMMTGLYPAGHGVHENGRSLVATHSLAAERLRAAGYRTGAFVSAFVLAKRFGLARGFDVYDDELGGNAVERTAEATAARALSFVDGAAGQPLFVWVHFFEPHAPYEPADPFKSRFAAKPYLGEVAAMDQQIGRLVQGFEQRVAARGGAPAIVIAGDHGEGLGDHGESQHGNLLYQSTMHVPLVLAGPGVAVGVSDTAVSVRRIFHTLLDWGGLDKAHTLRGDGGGEVVIGEAMKPYLEYGWQPQIMAVDGRQKAIFAGTTEVYDLGADPGETKTLGSGANLPAAMRKALDEYPVPSIESARAPDNLSDEARRSLASLGYVSASAPPVVRKGAPRPIDMVGIFDLVEQASTLFVQGRYAEAIPLFEKVLAADAFNLDAALRLATSHSTLGQDAKAVAAFRRAAEIAPRSPDVRLYLALHYARGAEWTRAIPVLEQIVADTPDRLPAVEALASIRERQGRTMDAMALRQRVMALRTPAAADFAALGRLAMAAQQTPLAIESFEKARSLDPAAFRNDLELGVLYLAARRLAEARDALDRVPSAHPDYAMALFKRAQVSVLLKEPDSAARIAAARRGADATTRDLIESERLFQTGSPVAR